MSAERMERKNVELEPGDMLCIRYGQSEWGFSGDRFVSREGDWITAKQQFANGAIRNSVHAKEHFKVLRGTELFHIL